MSETEKWSEIYTQRYETFRHLDKLRWQMLQIAVAAASVVFVFGNSDSNWADWGVWAIAGAMFLVLGASMLQIGEGIRKNGETLQRAGEELGDKDIPEPTPHWRSVSFLTASAMVIVGFACLLLSLYYLACHK